jgi:hypothetical protein
VSKVAEVNNRPLAQRFVGSWKLMSYEARSDDGHRVTYPLSDDAKGYILYTLMATCRHRSCRQPATQSSPHAPRAVHNAPFAFGTELLTAVLVRERA